MVIYNLSILLESIYISQTFQHYSDTCHRYKTIRYKTYDTKVKINHLCEKHDALFEYAVDSFLALSTSSFTTMISSFP